MSPTARAGFGVTVTVISLAYVIYQIDIIQLAVSFADVSFLSLAGILATLCLNLLLVSLRFQRLMRHFGVEVNYYVAVRANIAGAIASLYLLQILGGLLGRHHILKQFGAAASVTAIVTYYERIIVAVIAGGLCLLGLFLLDHSSLTRSALASLPKLEFWLTLTIATAASLMFARTHFEQVVRKRLLKLKIFVRILETSGLTLSGQLLNLTAFVIALLMLKADASLLTLFSAAAIVSFAATLPISANGWGIREFAALHVFGLLGVPPSDAVAVSILIGLGSTVIILAGYFGFSARKIPETDHTETQRAPDTLMISAESNTIDFDKLIAWLLAHAAAVLLFFQAPIVIGTSSLTINLADPIALMALLVLGLTATSSRLYSIWNIKNFNVWILAITACLILGFAIGVHAFGVTSWALANRLAGWLVILGYVSAGALAVTIAGRQGLRRFCETLMVTAATVILLQLLMRFGVTIGIPFDAIGKFEGFSGNKNALAFQLLIVAACGLAYSGLKRSPRQKILWSMLLGIVLLGIWSSLGRTALVTLGIMLTAAFVFRIADRKTIFTALIVVICGHFGFDLLRHLFLWLYASAGIEPGIQVLIGGTTPYLVQSGDTERIQSMMAGLRMWLEHPVFGAGLGAFVRLGLGENGLPLVIHNTPIWLLAELGLVGAIVCGAFFVTLLWSARDGLKRAYSPQHKILLLSILCFGLFGLVHEIFYQRIFWLILGAAAAMPAVFRLSNKQ